MAGDTRNRMIDATVAMLQRQGVAGTSFTEVLTASGAARGAIYHHFPGGKAQLVAEAAACNGEEVRRHLAGLPAGSPRAVLDGFLELVRPVVAASAAGGGCAVAAVTVGPDAPLDVAAAAFASWTDQLTERLTVSGLAPAAAADLAATLIVLLEGAHILCRASASIEPFDRVARTAAGLVR
jgi:TetR/AcrR family transcriptional repressor of lmrAB and yxaGH operons